MRVCIDFQLALLNPTGVGRYTLELVKHLDNLIEQDELILFQFNNADFELPFQLKNATRKIVRLLPGRVIRRTWRYFDKIPSFNLFSGPADVFHFTNFIRPPLRCGKSVITIHDMSFLRYPEYAPTSYAKYLSGQIQDTVRKADVILTDSDFSKQEIGSLLNVDSTRLCYVYPGISSEFHRADVNTIENLCTRYNIDRPYILLVSTIEPRKNITFLIDLFEQLKYFDGYLIIAGKLGWKYDTIMKRIRTSSKSKNIRYIEYIDQNDLASLYSGAELFVFPSFYEGFGLPPLEAMACGVPVVSSAGGSLGEVLGDGAYVMHDYKIDMWVNILQKILEDTVMKKNLINAGYRQVKKYSWNDTAKEILSIYRSLA